MKYFTSLLIGFSIMLISCQQNQTTDSSRLGKVDFNVTGSKEAMEYFKQGHLLLHSFEYDDAREQFIKARETDPTMSMAYWGEAMCYNHSLWSEQEQDKAMEVLNMLGETEDERLGKAGSEIEKDFIKGIGILYESDEEKMIRDQAYADYMATLYNKYPGNDEVAAFYSLSLLATVPDGRDFVIFEQAATVAKEILRRNPEHPGALHYLIHSYDDPEHAIMALDAADKYTLVAPDAAHALHMPTHIYLPLGMWDKLIASNINSWEASKSRKERKELDNDALGYHSYLWLIYGLLQQDRFAEADSMANDMVTFTEALPSKTARNHLSRVKGTLLVGINSYDNKLADVDVKVDDLRLESRSGYAFIEGMKYYSKNDREGLEATIMAMEKDISDEAGKVLMEGITVCSIPDNESQPATQLSVDQSRVMEMELQALASWMGRDTVKTREYFNGATKLEASLSYSYGPPEIAKPSFELFGEWLLQIGEPDQALQMFNASLTRTPGRALSLKGKSEAENRIKVIALKQ